MSALQKVLIGLFLAGAFSLVGGLCGWLVRAAFDRTARRFGRPRS